MEELRRTRRITIATILIAVFLIVVMASITRPLFVYKLAPQELVNEMMMSSPITPDDAQMYVYDSTYRFVDIRNIYDFEKDHLEGAVNIPESKLLTEDSKKLFDNWLKDSLTVIIYGEDEVQASTSWMLLTQLGYNNTQVMMGGMDYMTKLYNDQLEENESFDIEQAQYDYAKIISSFTGNADISNSEQPKKKVIIRSKKKKAAEGGC